jgi:hypothetical protein
MDIYGSIILNIYVTITDIFLGGFAVIIEIAEFLQPSILLTSSSLFLEFIAFSLLSLDAWGLYSVYIKPRREFLK